MALAASSGRAARRELGIGGRAEAVALGSANSVSVSICWGCPGLDWVGGSPNLRRSIRRYPADFIEPAQIVVRRRLSKQKRPRRTAFNFLISLRKFGAGEGISNPRPQPWQGCALSDVGHPNIRDEAMRHLPDGMAESATNCPKAFRRLLPSCFRGRRDAPMDPLST